MNLLCVPFKKCTDVDLRKPLQNFVRAFLNSPADCEEFAAFEEFGNLRTQAISRFGGKHESSLEYIYRYHDQLCCLENKIPVDELQIAFKWTDAFDKGSIFGGKVSLTHNSLKYEKLCILFNIGASQSAVAASQSPDSDDGLKSAIKYFQQAAGIFQSVKEIVPNVIPSEPTPDLNCTTLTNITNLMMAQAQELFILKAIRDKLKDAVIAKLCNECQEIYSDILNGIQKDSNKSLWDKNWISTFSGKQCGYYAMMQLYQSFVCRDSKNIGEEISRLKDSVDHFQVSQSMPIDFNHFSEYCSIAKRRLSESMKDNDFIYNEIIPDAKTLPIPGKVRLAKLQRMGFPFSQNFRDLFSNLIPVAVHQAISASDARKNEAFSVEIMRLREATNNLNALLASLNLPAAVEMDYTGSGLPPSLQNKSVDLKNRGGVQSIYKLIKELPELLTRNREILDESERMLEEEQKSDILLRSQFKERWTRVPSEKLTGMFRSNAQKYRDIINNAIEADQIVRQKFEKHKKEIEILSGTMENIEEVLPSSIEVNISNNPAAQKLRKMMEAVNVLKSTRDRIESDLKDQSIDLKEAFMDSFKKDGFIDEPTLTIPEIARVLQPLQMQTEGSMKQQEKLIGDIKEAYNEFIAATGSDNVTRDKLLSDLAIAYDSFIDLQNNLKEGVKFYNDLTQLLVVFQNKITDFCFARKTEKDELLKDLTQAASRQDTVPIIADNTVHAIDSAVSLPYPKEISVMPLPIGANNTTIYPAYIAPPMPQGFNPYASLPYPSTIRYYGYPEGPSSNQNYGTYPGSFSSQQTGNPQQGKPPGW